MKRGMFLSIFLAVSLVFAFTFAFSQEEEIKTFKYSATTDIGGMEVKSQFYFKEGKFRVDTDNGGQRTIMIYDGEKAYMYNPQLKTAFLMPGAGSAPDISMPHDFKNTPGLNIIGEETMNGQLCDVYEFNQDGNKAKSWVAKGTDFPVKTEVNAGGNIITTQMTNFAKNIDLPDALFSLPEGVEVMETEQFLKEMGQ